MSFHQLFRNIFGLPDRKPPDNYGDSTFQTDCPAYIRFTASQDGRSLEVTGMNVEHNHAVTEELYRRYPQQRRLPEEVQQKAKELLKLKANRKLVKEQLEAETGKIILMRDLTNIAASDLPNDKNNLSVTVQKLQQKYGADCPVLSDDENTFINTSRPSNLPSDEFRNPIWNLDEDDDDEDFRTMQPSPFGFRVFNDPIEIHRFFEHQMDQMLKSFQGFHNVLDNFNSSHFDSRAPEDMLETEDRKRGSLRDQYLKPSFKAITDSGFTKEKAIDQDLDDKVKSNGLDSILKDRPLLDIHPDTINKNPDLKIFGRSVVTHTVRRPDGTFEHHSTVKDNQGNEETTVKRQIGDQIYTVTTQVDCNGVQKRTENFINIEEGNVTEFEKRWNHRNDDNFKGIDNEPRHHNWFPFDKFFR